MEGVNGIVRNEHVDPACGEYQTCLEWMIAEVNAAAEGATAAGVHQVIVNDSHNHMSNLRPDKLHPSISLVTGPVKPFSMVQDLDENFIGALFLGYHARFGTPKALFDHTFSYNVVQNLQINGVSVGEFGLNAGMAGHYGVPALMVTGDQCVTAEAKALMPDINMVVVKEARSRHAALCYPFSKTIKEIRNVAQISVKEAGAKNGLRFETPLKLSVTFLKTEMADAASIMPGTERTDNFSVTAVLENYIDLYNTFLTLYRLSRI